MMLSLVAERKLRCMQTWPNSVARSDLGGENAAPDKQACDVNDSQPIVNAHNCQQKVRPTCGIVSKCCCYPYLEDELNLLVFQKSGHLVSGPGKVVYAMRSPL